MGRFLMMSISCFNKILLLFLFVFLLFFIMLDAKAAEAHVSQNTPSFSSTSSLQNLIIAAKQGDPLTQFMLGADYLEGKDVEKSGRKAFEWFQKAADQGFAAAQCFLGKMYIEGKTIEKNEKKAFEWFQKAANQGHIESQFFLGKMYADGKGVEKNEKKAFEWLTQAVEQRYSVEKLNKKPASKYYSKTFRKLLQSLPSKKEIPFEANIRQLSSFKDAIPLLEKIPPDTLVIFDMDDTLVVYRDESLPPALTESFTPNLIRKLQEKGIKTIALTATTVVDAPQEELRYKELLEVGIDFSRSFQEFFIFNNFPLYKEHYPLLSKGIIYTNSMSKGEVLSAFLEKVKDSLQPSLIIFFDDRLNNILDVKKAAEERNINYVGFFYNKILNWLYEGMSYEEIQIKLLQSQSGSNNQHGARLMDTNKFLKKPSYVDYTRTLRLFSTFF